MINLIIIMVLLWQFYLGYSRGIILQGLYTFGAVVAFLVARVSYLSLAKKIALWIPYSNPVEGVSVNFFKSVNLFALDNIYYAGVAFIITTLVIYLVFRLIGVFAHVLPLESLDSPTLNGIAGGLSALVSLLFMAMILTALSTVPLSGIQTYLSSHLLLRFLIDGIPLFSSLLQHLWMLAL